MQDILNLINSIFGITNDKSATILITLFTFTFGLIFQILLKYIYRYFEKKTIRKNFANILDIGISEANKKSQLFSVAVDEINDPNASIVETPESILTFSKLMDDLGYQTTYSALFSAMTQFLNKKKFKSFKKIWWSKYSMEHWDEKAIKSFGTFLADLKTNNSNRTNAITSFQNKLNELLKDNTNLKIIELCNPIISSWQQLEDSNTPTKIYNNLITPLLQTLQPIGEYNSNCLVLYLLEYESLYKARELKIAAMSKQLKAYSNLFKMIKNTLIIAKKCS